MQDLFGLHRLRYMIHQKFDQNVVINNYKYNYMMKHLMLIMFVNFYNLS